jgi:hypothetical protein
MDTFLRTFPFAVAEVLLLWGVLRFRPVVFIGSFVVLVVACAYSLVSEGSSAVFSFIGLCVIVFAVSALLLASDSAADAVSSLAVAYGQLVQCCFSSEFRVYSYYENSANWAAPLQLHSPDLEAGSLSLGS